MASPYKETPAKFLQKEEYLTRAKLTPSRKCEIPVDEKYFFAQASQNSEVTNSSRLLRRLTLDICIRFLGLELEPHYLLREYEKDGEWVNTTIAYAPHPFVVDMPATWEEDASRLYTDQYRYVGSETLEKIPFSCTLYSLVDNCLKRYAIAYRSEYRRQKERNVFTVAYLFKYIAHYFPRWAAAQNGENFKPYSNPDLEAEIEDWRLRAEKARLKKEKRLASKALNP